MDNAAKNKHFATWLAGAMQQARVDEEELARRIDKPLPAVRYWVRGDRRPLRDSCRDIARALEVDAAEVMIAAFRLSGVIDGPDDEPPEPPAEPAPPTSRRPPYEGGTTALTGEEIVRMRTMFAILEDLSAPDISCLQALAQVLRAAHRDSAAAAARDSAQQNTRP